MSGKRSGALNGIGNIGSQTVRLGKVFQCSDIQNEAVDPDWINDNSRLRLDAP